MFFVCHMSTPTLSEESIKAFDASPSLRQLISYDWPSLSEDDFLQSQSLFVLPFFEGASECYLWMMLLISLLLDLNLTVFPPFSWMLLRSSLWGRWTTFFSVIPQDFKLLHRMSGAMHHACFGPGLIVAQAVCMFSIVLASTAIIRVLWRGKSSTLVCTDMDSMVGIWPVLVDFIRCSHSIDLLCSFLLI